MAVIRLQLLPFNTVYQNLNITFADYGSMQYFVEKVKYRINKQMQQHEEKMSFFVKMLYVIQPLLRKDNKIM